MLFGIFNETTATAGRAVTAKTTNLVAAAKHGCSGTAQNKTGTPCGRLLHKQLKLYV
jgi:hypothetical protein